LIHGYSYSYIFKPIKSLYRSLVELEIAELACVRRMTTTAETISVTFWPDGFERENANANANANVLVSAESSTVTSNIELIMEIFKKHSVKLAAGADYKMTKSTLYPHDKETFLDLFVNYSSKQVLKQDTFSVKSQGLVSYFESYDTKSFPTQTDIQVVKVPMNKIQFGKYITVRQKEIEKEKKARSFGGDDGQNKGIGTQAENDMKSGNVYRAFSRAICNFVFPEEIERPYPSTLKQFKQEVDEADEDFGPAEKEKPLSLKKEKIAEYNRLVALALKKLKQDADLYLSPEGLTEHGPKIRAIMDKIDECPGSALVYSSFRNVEGVKIMSMAMDYAGYVELKVKKEKGKNGVWKLHCDDFSLPLKYIIFTENREETEILMNLFNSDLHKLPASIVKELKERRIIGINDDKVMPLHHVSGKKCPRVNTYGEIVKVLMITQSGAQGISLKNVRQVHLLEPFWNEIRIKQVRGRAIRAMSHMALPSADRTVDTFLYIMSLDLKEQFDHPLIKGHDQGMSSDGYILDIAKRKSVINDQFLQLVKNSSVDCGLNKKAHGTGVSCYKVKANRDNDKGNGASTSASASASASVKAMAMSRLFKTFRFKKLNQEFSYLLNPTDAEQTAFLETSGKAKDDNAIWTGLYLTDQKTLVGVAKIDKQGKLLNLIIQ
jgi:hypothetical protein